MQHRKISIKTGRILHLTKDALDNFKLIFASLAIVNMTLEEIDVWGIDIAGKLNSEFCGWEDATGNRWPMKQKNRSTSEEEIYHSLSKNLLNADPSLLVCSY